MKKIAFVSTHSHPINKNLYRVLKESFSDFKVDKYDLEQLIFKKKTFYIINLFYMLMEYGFEILVGKKKARECFFRTTFIFSKVKKVITEKINNDNYTFSIQSNSLYDTSTGKIPHFIYTDHTHLENLKYPLYDKNNLFSESWLVREKSIYDNATMNFTYSTNVRKSIIRDYDCPEEKAKCIYAGSNVKQDNEPILNNENYGNKNIIFVGVYWERKGGPDLVQAFKKVLEVHPDANLTIVGCTPNVKITNCNIVGKIKVEELSKYYLNSSIFCLPTKREPFGIVFIEAMMHKLPIVANRIGALPDFVSENKSGVLVEPGNINQLAEALIQLLNNPQLCKDYGNAGFTAVENNYTWERVGERLKENICPFID